MNVETLLADFDADVRKNPPVRPGLKVERLRGIVRLTGAFNFISSWDFSASSAAVEVAEQAAHFRQRGEAVMWRIYEHDLPRDLPAHLAANGFRPTDHGTLMFLDLAKSIDALPSGTIDVRRVRTLEDLDGFIEASDAAFDDDDASQQRPYYLDSLEADSPMLFIASIAGTVVASARLEVTAGGRFGMLFGGGVIATHRGQGAYRALLAARADAARTCGLRYLSTEALDTSRPILERMGFVPVVRETTWVLDPASI